MNFIISTVVMMSGQTDVRPSPSSVGFELEIWKWVVIIGIAALIIIFAIKRIADFVTRIRTDSMIENVVGKGEAEKARDWVEEEEDDS